jgi:hypothetical protein
MWTRKSNKLKVSVSYGNGPPRTFERITRAPDMDVAAAISAALIAFNEAFEHELQWIEQRSAEEAEACSLPPAA